MNSPATKVRPRRGRAAVALGMALALMLSMLAPWLSAASSTRAWAASTIEYGRDDGVIRIYKYADVSSSETELGRYPSQSDMENWIDQNVDRTDDALANVQFTYLKVGDILQQSVTTDGTNTTTIGYSITNSTLLNLLASTGVTLEAAFTDSGTPYYPVSSLQDALDRLTQVQLSNFITNNGGTAMALTDSNGYTYAEGLSVGLYLIVETSYPAEVTSPSAPFFVSVPMTDDNDWIYDITVYPKNSTGNIYVGKSVIEDGADAGSIDGETGQAKTFRITNNLPTDMSVVSSYVITDQLSSGLTFAGTNTVEVYGVTSSGTYELLNTAHYTLTVDPSTGEGALLTFSFIPSAMVDNYGQSNAATRYSQIEIRYQAYLNANAVVGGNGNANDVDLTYETTTGATGSVEADPVHVYTYAIALTKVGDGDYNKTLEGVQFTLHDSTYDSSNPGASEIAVAELSDGSYYYVIGDLNAQSATLTTGTGGYLEIRGLEKGTYYLVETATTGNYNLLAEAVRITIDSNEGTYTEEASGTYFQVEAGATYYLDSEGTVELHLPEGTVAGDWVTVGTSNVYDNSSGSIAPTDMYEPNDPLTWSATVGGENATMGSDGNIVFTVNNQSGFELPLTGGAGAIWFLVVGGVLVAIAAGAIYLAVRKKDAKKKAKA